jgi:hypothetical protein
MLSGTEPFRAVSCCFVLSFRREIAMSHGDLETQSTNGTATSAEAPDNQVPAESSLTEPVNTAAAVAEPRPATMRATFMDARTPRRSKRSRLRSRIRTVWLLLREQRREAAAAIVLMVIAILWLDTGSSDTGTAPDAPDSLDAFEAALSEFEPFEDAQPKQESADPFESTPQNSFSNGLFIPPSEGSASGMAASAESGKSTTATARYPEDAQTLNASSAQSTAEQQQRRKVKFAGRIQPAN